VFTGIPFYLLYSRGFYAFTRTGLGDGAACGWLAFTVCAS
jgi:hypothetical protein